MKGLSLLRIQVQVISYQVVYRGSHGSWVTKCDPSSSLDSGVRASASFQIFCRGHLPGVEYTQGLSHKFIPDCARTIRSHDDSWTILPVILLTNKPTNKETMKQTLPTTVPRDTAR